EVITSVVNEALRDFKAAMEGRGSRRSEAPAATGPADSGWREAGKDRAEENRKQPASVDYTRPPQAKYP
ncbi:MAG TPA: hypothetical protein VMZ25_10065, partial [Terriglobales bacterium]|nr:hypothetical protein [Terriglobales bacterium]